MKKLYFCVRNLFFIATVFSLSLLFLGSNVKADTAGDNNPFINKVDTTGHYKPVIENVDVNQIDGTIDISWSVNSDDYSYFQIYRSASDDVYEYYDVSNSTSYTDYNAYVGVHYQYKIVTVYLDENDDELYSEPAFVDDACIPVSTPYIGTVTPAKSHSLKISWYVDENLSGYELYRSTSKNGTYTLVKNMSTSTYFNYFNSYSYKDSNLSVGKTYYYKLRGYMMYDGIKYYGDYSPVKSETVRTNAPIMSQSYSKKAGTNTLKWKSVSDCNGYIIYFKSSAKGKYTKLKTLNGKSKLTFTHKKLKNGKLYFYKIYSYKKIGNRTLNSCEPKIYEKYCDYYTFRDEPYENRMKRLFGNSKTYWYNTSSKASKNMKELKIKVWDVNYRGKKYTRTFYISVHKNLAPSVKKMFKEIYKSKERFPIHEIGCYNWRGKGSTSEHCIGTAFDINSNENYMIDNGKILAGSFWKPKKSKYSIPLNCQLVKILEKYGFSRGFWGNRKDYMHFSYLGT